MRLFVNDAHRKRAIISSIIMAIFFMTVMSWGSFDPRDSGFWGCILISLFIGFVGDYILMKLKSYSDTRSNVKQN